ncbi:hypothetical protein [Agrobacterium sp. CG674]
MTKARKNKAVKTVAAPVEQLPDMGSFFADVNAAAEIITEEAKASDAILKLLEEQAALEAQAKAEAEAAAPQEAPVEEETTDEAIVLPHTPGDIKEMIANVTLEQRTAKAAEIASELATRIDNDTRGERVMGPSKLNSLQKAQKELATVGAAGFFVAADIDPSFINRSISGDGRFNVYALDKIRDLITGVDGGFLKNPINRAVLLSLFNFRDAGVPFTMGAMQAAISHDVKVEGKNILKHLVRHTVAASTAPTQSSQMSHALQAMGIVTAQTIGRMTTFTLTDTPTVRRLEQVLRAA